MWAFHGKRAPTSRVRRVLTWLRGHPGLALAAVTGALAVFRLLAVSHGELRTARVLLDRADPAALAGGLVLSAALLWLPAVFAAATYVGLNVGRWGEKVATWVGIIGMAVAIFGTLFLWNVLDLEFEDIAEGGPSWVAITATIGLGAGGVLHFILFVAENLERPAPDEVAASPDVEAPSPPATDPSAESTPSTPRPFGRVGRAIEVTFGGLMGLAVTLFALSLTGFVLIGLWTILSEPSQPPENVTVTIDGRTETRTVHVIDDDGAEVLMMARGDRTILSAHALTIDDRYICDRSSISRTHTRDVAVALTDGTLRAALESVEKIGEGDDLTASLARDWIEAVVATPPPCSPEWTVDELDEVRSALGYTCHELTGCAKRP